MSMNNYCVSIAYNGYSGILESIKTGKWYYLDEVCLPTEIEKIDGDIVGIIWPSDEYPNLTDISAVLENGEMIPITWIGGEDDDWSQNVEAGIETDDDYDDDFGWRF